ncbi:hypothetical protein Tco_1041306 [Tanacetum coccineum]|uniref:Uncharacterized protein n=1 Tax=Tanacetum coccineum TaxID=301880 RepID=A0ABQ5GFT1_9ASTR
MVTVPIQQVSSSVPLLITSVIDLSSPKPVSPPFTAPAHISSGPGPQLLTPRTILVPQPPSPTPNVPPTKNDWDSLFCPIFDEYFNPFTKCTSQTTQEEQSHVIPTSVEEDDHGIKVTHMDNDLYEPGFQNEEARRHKDGCPNNGIKFSQARNYAISVHPRSNVRYRLRMKHMAIRYMFPRFRQSEDLPEDNPQPRSSLRTASVAAKPCQGDSLEFYLITGRIRRSAAGQDHVQFTTPCSHFIFLIKDIMIAERPTTQLPQL